MNILTKTVSLQTQNNNIEKETRGSICRILYRCRSEVEFRHLFPLVVVSMNRKKQIYIPVQHTVSMDERTNMITDSGPSQGEMLCSLQLLLTAVCVCVCAAWSALRSPAAHHLIASPRVEKPVSSSSAGLGSVLVCIFALPPPAFAHPCAPVCRPANTSCSGLPSAACCRDFFSHSFCKRAIKSSPSLTLPSAFRFHLVS